MLNCFPTTDVHLLTAAGRDQSLALYAFENWPIGGPNAVWTDLSTVPELRMQLIGVPAAATVVNSITGSLFPTASEAFTLNPVSVGTGIASTTVQHPALSGQQISDLIRSVRITVHADVDRFWIPVGSITMFAGESNRLVPITAIFDDASQGDVTSHPYFTYTTSDATRATVDANGRVTAVGDGPVTITVTLRGTAMSQTVNATIRPALVTGHSHASVISHGSVSGNRARIYVISEGYDDPFQFEDDFNEVVRLWFESSQNEPFKLLRDRFAIFGIVDLAPTRGITIGPVLDTQANAAPTTIAAAALTGPLRTVDERDTRFGLMYGARLGDPVMRPASPATIERWLTPPRAHRVVHIDWRRRHSSGHGRSSCSRAAASASAATSTSTRCSSSRLSTSRSRSMRARRSNTTRSGSRA
jgi:Bacterial Ig-like domain (group 2)